MAPRPIGKPRLIDPSLVEVGDDIAVEHPASRGITTILRGIVHHRMESGKNRFYVTSEGATLFAYSPGEKHNLKITLFARDEVPQTTMFELPEDIVKRIAS